jgi:ABC-2 type transport system permease protein
VERAIIEANCIMNTVLREIRFMLRQRASIWALALLTCFAALAVGLGLQEVSRQKAAIAQVIALQKTDTAATKLFAKEAGDGAYYRFHPTWDAPSPLAFAALGQRDIAPTVLRIRALALEGQIYESEAQNPELVLPGRFDFTFVLIYLAPLVLIALLHDLWSSEREAGRLASLQVVPKSTFRVWAPRIGARLGLVFGALVLPFWAGALISGAALGEIAMFTSLILALVFFWTIIATLIASQTWRSSTNAAALATIWLVITLIAPAGANLAINAATPIPDGSAIMRENREAVHDAWDLPRDATLQRFYKLYPELANAPPMKRPFEWKWYFAFQHLGDEQVKDQSRAYREGIARRDARAGYVAWTLPPIAIQRALHRLARTDVAAQSAFEGRIRAYHTRLRTYYYPFLFSDKPFTAADFDGVPEFEAP